MAEKFSKKKIYFTGMLSGVLLALSFPPMPLFLFAFIGFIPLLFALEMKDCRKPFLILYLTFFIYHGGTNWWISSWQAETDPYLLASGIAVWLVHPFFFFIPFAFYFYVRKKLGLNTALWLFPFFWTAFEWFHSLGDLSYPWLTIGYTQIYNYYWVQIADIGGVWGVSFLIAFGNILIFKMILLMRYENLRIINIKEFFQSRKMRFYLTAIFLLIIIPIIYGVSRTGEFEYTKLIKKEKHLRIGLIQPNIDPWVKWKGGVMSQVIKHKLITDSLRKSVHYLDLAIWSETAIPMLTLEFNRDHDFTILQKWLDTSHMSLLTGFADLYFYKKNKEAIPNTAKYFVGDTNRPYDAYNAAILLNPAPFDKKLYLYRKMKLTPFAERLPYEEYLLFARKWFEWGVGISSWGKGNSQNLLDYKLDNKSAKVASIICIESIYPGFVRNFANEGADLFTIITNDAWYNHTFGPEQHYLIGCMRAIENRRYIARCANTGVTGFITPTGRSILEAKQYVALGVAADVPLMEQKSFYVLYGDWLPLITGIISIIALIYSVFKRKSKFH